MTDARIYVGIGGWVFDQWRGGAFYPEKLPQKRELEYASRKVTSIEINGSYYRTPTRSSFEKWFGETPDDFVFSLKGLQYITVRRDLSEAGDSVKDFVESGLAALKHKLGVINWQLPPSKKFKPEEIEAFFKVLPPEVEGWELRHAVEVRHESFRTPAFVELARRHRVAIVNAADSKYPQIEEITAPFVYARIMGTSDDEPLGYSNDALDKWTASARNWAGDQQPKDVFFYFISGAKHRNPKAAMAMIERLGGQSRASEKAQGELF